MFGKVDRRKKWLAPIVSTIEEIVKIKVPEDKITEFEEREYFGFRFRVENNNEVGIYIAASTRPGHYLTNFVEYSGIDSDPSVVVRQLYNEVKLKLSNAEYISTKIGLFSDYNLSWREFNNVYKQFVVFVKDIVTKIWSETTQHEFVFIYPDKYYVNIAEELYNEAHKKLKNSGRKKSKGMPTVMVDLSHNIQLKLSSTFPVQCKNKGYLEITVGQIYDERYQSLVDFINQKAKEHGFFVES